MTYSEKLKDPRWQKRRLEILQRDNFTCKLCGDDKSELHIHHAAYKKGLEPWEYSGDWLHTVCARCHEHAALIRTAACLNLMANRQSFDLFDIAVVVASLGRSKEGFDALKVVFAKAMKEECSDEE